MTPAELDAFAAVMLSRRIRRVTGAVEDEEFCIEMDASAFPAPALPADKLPLEPQPTAEEILFASSVPVTEWEKKGRDPE